MVDIFTPDLLTLCLFSGFLKKAFKAIGKVTWRSHSFRRVAAVAGVAAGAYFLGAGPLLTKAVTGAKSLGIAKAAGGLLASNLLSRSSAPQSDATQYSEPPYNPGDYYGAPYTGASGQVLGYDSAGSAASPLRNIESDSPAQVAAGFPTVYLAILLVGVVAFLGIFAIRR